MTPLPTARVEIPAGLAFLPTLIDQHSAAGLAVTLDIVGQPPDSGSPADQAVYRILQEALTNAARHGQGSAAIALSFDHAAAEVTVTNPSRAQQRQRSGGGHGLVGMRERVTLLGGTLHAERRARHFPCAGAHSHRRAPLMTRVLIADDDHLMRAGLAELLSYDPVIEIVGQAGTGREAVERAGPLKPDVILMDVRMPDTDGIAATRQLTQTLPEVKILVLTTFEQDDYIFGALRAGASGFLLKRTRPEELIAAVHTIAGGDCLLSPSVTRRVIARMAQQPTPEYTATSTLAQLTARERQVLELICRGLSNREIASALVVEESTIRTHVKRILMKLGLRDRIQAVIYGYENGLIQPAT